MSVEPITIELEPVLRASVDSLLDLEDEVVRDNVRARLFGSAAAPRTIGRFEIDRRVGAGAMGEVFAARDPRLGREVAVKLLRRHGHDEATTARIRERMLSEARALGRLSHPHVIEVFDVGIRDNRVYIAMELVSGDDLRRFRARNPSDWRTLLDLYVQAGRGLDAVHRAGLVHRDFKPDNAVVGPHGRVRILDFGLAIDNTEPTEPNLVASPQPARGRLTMRGAHVGTCGYMAPEQALGGLAGPAADQFSFCAALWEGLSGQLPFHGATPTESARAALRGALDSSLPAAVPRAVQRALRRGLAANPWERWPGMAHLLARLDRTRRSSRRVAWIAGFGAVTLSAAVWIGWPSDSVCETPAPDGARERWTPLLRERLAARFADVEGSLARPTWERVDGHIEAFVAEWETTHDTLCEAGRLEHHSTDARNPSAACLDDQRHQLAATLSVFEHADATTVERALAVVEPLRERADCLELAGSSVGPPTPSAPADGSRTAAARTNTTPTETTPARTTAIARMKASLPRVAALERAGRYDQAATQARGLVDSAREARHPQLTAQALLRLGSARIELGQIEPAATVLEEAYFLGLGLGDDTLLRQAATRLVHLWGIKAARFDEAIAWSRHATAAVTRLPSAQGEAELFGQLATLYAENGRHARAREHAQHALAVLEPASGVDDTRVADAVETLAGVEHRMGNLDAALEHYRRVHQLRVDALGSEHPRTLLTVMRMALNLDEQGQHEQAEARFREILTKLEAAVGPHHPAVAMVLINLAANLQRQQRNEQARPPLERALSIRAKIQFDHPHTAMALHNLGNLAAFSGEVEQARQHYAQALGIFERTGRPGHPSVANIVTNLGKLAASEGDAERAGQHYWRAYAIYVASLGPDHPAVANLLYNLAQLALERGEHALAQRHAQRALSILERAFGPQHAATQGPREVLAAAAAG